MHARHQRHRDHFGMPGNQMKLTVVGTMGFPDTDTTMASQYYDKVVSACNQPLNAIIWVLKPEHTTQDLMCKHSTLMREFNSAMPQSS